MTQRLDETAPETGDSAGQPNTAAARRVPAPGRWPAVAVCLLLALAVWVVFGQTRHYEFVNQDDDVFICENPDINQGLSLKGVVAAFTHINVCEWYPLTSLSHMVDFQIYGLKPGGHHLTNVLLHAATAILLFLVLRNLTGAFWPSAFVAAVFAVHPLRVESVAWVTERKDVLSGLFFMLTLGAYTRYAQGRRRWSLPTNRGVGRVTPCAPGLVERGGGAHGVTCPTTALGSGAQFVSLGGSWNLSRSARSARRLTGVWLLLMALCALLPAGNAFAKEPPRFADVSHLVPEVTNAAPAVATNPAPLTAAAVHSATNATATDGTNSLQTLDDKYTLAIGDRLSFRIVEDEEDPKPLFVTDSGDLEVPYIGRFPALGKTCKELARALKAELEKEYYYQATVIVAVDLMTKSRGKVYLVGPVRAPGPQEIPSDEVLTLSKAILRAGGFSDFADKHKVKVTRRAAAGGPDRMFTVDVAEVLENGRTESDLPLEAGDLIYVPERLIRF